MNRRQYFIIKTPTSYSEEKKKGPEPCQFVSQGEKPAVRSNRPLIFLSCIKGTILLGGYTGEQALLIFTVYLILCQCIHSPQWNQSQIHCTDFFTHCIWIQSPCALVVLCLSVLDRRITASYFFDKTSPTGINPQKQQPVVQLNVTKAYSVSIYFPFLHLCSITG